MFPVVYLWKAVICDRIGAHNWESHSCYSFTLPFKKLTLKKVLQQKSLEPQHRSSLQMVFANPLQIRLQREANFLSAG